MDVRDTGGCRGENGSTGFRYEIDNVGLRPAYFHDGRFPTLEDVVAFYNRGGDFSAPNKPPVIRPLGLTPQQQTALVAFLRKVASR